MNDGFLIKNGAIVKNNKEFTEITEDTTAETFKNYVTNSENKIEITIPTTLVAKDRISISGKGAGGWKIKTNYIFIGYRKELLSNLFGDSIVLTMLDDDTLEVSNYETYFEQIKQYGYFGGGDDGGETEVIEYIDMVIISGNAIDSGDLVLARRRLKGLTGIQYGFWCGGQVGAVEKNEIEYVDITLVVSNAVDTGNLSGVRTSMARVTGTQYGFLIGGTDDVGRVDIIDYVDMTLAVSNATSGGTLSGVRSSYPGGVSGQQYGFVGGGADAGGSRIDTISYINMIVTTSNAVDSATLIKAVWFLSDVSGSAWGFFCGGQDGAATDVIQYIDMTLMVDNATNSGVLTVARSSEASVSGSQYGFIGGGLGVGLSNVIDYIDLTTYAINAIDRGNLTLATEELAGI